MKLTSIKVRHFKAVEDSGTIKLGPLTAFVGYNGTGKSSVIEACEFFQTYALGGVEAALTPWFKFDHILWQGAERNRAARSAFFNRPLEIELAGKIPKSAWNAALEVGELAASVGKHKARSVVAKREFLKVGKLKKEFFFEARDRGRPSAGSQIFDQDWAVDFRKWMFLSLNPHEIGLPRRRPESKAEEPLLKSGANLADILKTFLDQDQAGFDAMIEDLQYILPYAANVRPDITKDLVETRSLIQLTERFQSRRNVALPGWVLSSGSLRLLALLAALRHPNGPSVLFIEELENGLDPRAIGFVIDEIRSAVTSGEKQVILTTHSPYLLDKLALEHIVTVERSDGGPPVFRRPAQEEELRQWAEQFAPGSLYSMGMLRSKARRTR
ncbi:MAG: AAA family ATPase [Verrucomicrobia subdivision 3 bacterium]|nr:AAA family ATPase [Limisphaerales bacterium]